MITELRLENWKSYKNASLYIDALSVLIGTNASGKSNALDALLWLNRIALGSNLTSALNGEGAQAPVRGGVGWAARQPGAIFALSVVCRADETTDYEYRIEGKISENRCDLNSERLTRITHKLKNGTRASARKLNLFWTDPDQVSSLTIIARLYNEKMGKPHQMARTHAAVFQLVGQKLREEIQKGLDEVVGALREIFILDPIPSHMRDFSPLSEKLESDASNIAGVLAACTPDKQFEIEEAISKYATQLPERDIKRVFAETVGKFKSDAMLYCEEQWLDENTHHPRLRLFTTIDARGMSDGTLRFIAILTALQTRPKGSLLVIEEVDNGLHPSRAHLLLNMLTELSLKRGVDVLVTTHNPAMLDAMGTEMVPFITVANRDPNEGHSVLTLLEDVTQLPKLLAQGQLGRLSTQGLIEDSLSHQQENSGSTTSLDASMADA